MSLQAAYDQARSFLEVNKVEQAISVVQHILEYFPENLEAHRILGEAYLAGRQFDQAEEAFSRVLHSDPENIPAHVGLGITYERQSRLDLAVNEFEQALEVRPDMPELRSQLLRLYTDVWGAEGATLRLSRPGLARLYAKGHMLPQAIQEFRSVIDEYPDRFDARVGLAESLWRDGQTDVAAEVCEDMLAERPDVLKANLILGYIRQAAGDADGERYWRFAQQLEPYQQVAHALFEVMPDLPSPNLEIASWDEQSWQERRDREEAEREKMAAPIAASTPALVEEPDFFSGWGDAVEDAAPSRASSSHASVDDDDDFLANLLALSTPIGDGGGVDIDSSSGITPFSFDDMSGSEQKVEVDAEPQAAEPEMEPFSLADLGLSEDEVAQLSAAEPEPAEPEMEPFSLADLGLSEDEVAQLSAAEPEMEPFSLADLGLSEDEVAQLSAAEPEPAEPEMLPFSLEDLGLSLDEVAQLNAAAETGQQAQQTEPFSFDDVGVGDAPHTDSPAVGGPSGDTAGLAPFDWSSGDDAEIADDSGFDSDMDDLQPFSLDDLDLTSVDDYGSGGGSLPPSLQPFSIDDAPTSPVSRDLPMPSLEADDSSETGGYSWQQPSSKPRTDFLRGEAPAEPAEGSIFSKLRQRASELPKEELLPLPPVSLDEDDESAAYFSNDNDDVPLHDAATGSADRFAGGFRLPKEGAAQVTTEPEAAEPEAAEPELTPFSLADLGQSSSPPLLRPSPHSRPLALIPSRS
ncbi:lipopolysaccharide assembly protein LapB [Oscillochloris sp. ZM17-4]|uniref:tetratricopeptide repeat protein n=1 Tax=Oscillochloris sp. ZM17-4 TaxID=2866714 RepID=UPI00210570FF|nr:tetratricopeptide repeat protein [Oscillochloris sp. ZM17-4]